MNVDRIEGCSAPGDSVTDLLARASVAPAALVVSGEAGIGRSTLWLAGVAQAREHGFEVLSARAAVGESTLDYAVLADLLRGIDPAIWSNLPLPQRNALDLILLRDTRCDAEPNRRTAATAVATVVARLAETSPVLVAIDDLQWLDPASAKVLAFVARRLSGPVGMLTTVPTDARCSRTATELELPRASDVHRITLAPLTLGSLHAVISRRLGRSLPRPILVRIHAVSGGNPFYALELALATTDPARSDLSVLPGTLVDVVRTRIEPLGADVQQALLMAAALSAPTIEMVAQALDVVPCELVELLETAEDAGIVHVDGDRLRFAHPLLARGVYSGASPARRRRVHRRLATSIIDPVFRARHLALGSATADPVVLESLDSAAESARGRGAPTMAAELLDLAVGLGGDTPARRIRSASCHLAAGDVRRARAVLEQSMATVPPGPLRTHALGILAVVHLFDDSITAAAELLRQALAQSGGLSTARVQMTIAHAFTQLTGGMMAGAVASADAAAADATQLGDGGLLGQAVGMRLVLAMLLGDGLDGDGIQRSDDCESDTPIPLRSRMAHVHLLSWSGQLDRARAEIADLAQQGRDRGDEHEQLYVGFHSAAIEAWRGNLPAAAELARDVTERAEQLGGDIPSAMASTLQATLDAYAGRVHEARAGGRGALAASQRCGAETLSRSAITTLAFLESSVGDHAAVLTLVAPLLDADAALPRATEIATAAYLPDAIEALITVGRLDEADALIDRLDGNGHRLDRAWMLAVGSRCRAMWCAARGDLDVAAEAIERAMVHHERLAMPFEKARSQLVLGQLQRRHRRRDEASATLTAALATFETMGTPLWAARARAELARSSASARNVVGLTSSERAVAELAATGMTNRDVAANLFISPKTVEAHLGRIYRKLNIRSRAELGRHMASIPETAA